jgi:hypothetical protein
METASRASSRKAGIGRISRTMTPMTASAIATSPLASQPRTMVGVGRVPPKKLVSAMGQIRPRSANDVVLLPVTTM